MWGPLHREASRRQRELAAQSVRYFLPCSRAGTHDFVCACSFLSFLTQMHRWDHTRHRHTRTVKLRLSSDMYN